ncbi:butyrophilin-like protein 2, partial [Clarias magur]
DFISLNLQKEIKMAKASNDFKLNVFSGKERYNPSAVTLSCRLSPEISAVAMEIRWFKETDCVCVYKNRQVTEGRRYEGRVSLFTQELERGNVSLQLRHCTLSDTGHYVCEVTDGDRTEEITVEMRGPSTLKLFGVMVYQINRKWTEDERMKMQNSALQTVNRDKEVESDKEVKTCKNKLGTVGQELQDMKRQLEEMTIVLKEQKTELAKKDKQLEEKERLLTEKQTQLMERDKLLEDKKKHHEQADPESTDHIRRRNCKEGLTRE